MNVLLNAKRPAEKALSSKMKICVMNVGAYRDIIAFVVIQTKSSVRKT